MVLVLCSEHSSKHHRAANGVFGAVGQPMHKSSVVLRTSNDDYKRAAIKDAILVASDNPDLQQAAKDRSQADRHPGQGGFRFAGAAQHYRLLRDGRA
jgi:hypothetical protein